MEKLFAAVLAALALSLAGFVPPVVPQPWAAGGGVGQAVRRVPCNGSVKRCPGPAHPKATTSNPDLRRPRPEVRRPVRF